MDSNTRRRRGGYAPRPLNATKKHMTRPDGEMHGEMHGGGLFSTWKKENIDKAKTDFGDQYKNRFGLSSDTVTALKTIVTPTTPATSYFFPSPDPIVTLDYLNRNSPISSATTKRENYESYYKPLYEEIQRNNTIAQTFLIKQTNSPVVNLTKLNINSADDFSLSATTVFSKDYMEKVFFTQTEYDAYFKDGKSALVGGYTNFKDDNGFPLLNGDGKQINTKSSVSKTTGTAPRGLVTTAISKAASGAVSLAGKGTSYLASGATNLASGTATAISNAFSGPVRSMDATINTMDIDEIPIETVLNNYIVIEVKEKATSAAAPASAASAATTGTTTTQKKYVLFGVHLVDPVNPMDAYTLDPTDMFLYPIKDNSKALARITNLPNSPSRAFMELLYDHLKIAVASPDFASKATTCDYATISPVVAQIISGLNPGATSTYASLGDILNAYVEMAEKDNPTSSYDYKRIDVASWTSTPLVLKSISVPTGATRDYNADIENFFNTFDFTKHANGILSLVNAKQYDNNIFKFMQCIYFLKTVCDKYKSAASATPATTAATATAIASTPGGIDPGVIATLVGSAVNIYNTLVNWVKGGP